MLKADGLAEGEELGSNILYLAGRSLKTNFSGPEGRTTTISRGSLAPHAHHAVAEHSRPKSPVQEMFSQWLPRSP